MTDLSRLREVAEKATKNGLSSGEWVEYKRACDPQTVVSLIAVVEAAREIDDFDCLTPEWDGPSPEPVTCRDNGHPATFCSNCKMSAALASLEEGDAEPRPGRRGDDA